jgi:hypothetical protein
LAKTIANPEEESTQTIAAEEEDSPHAAGKKQRPGFAPGRSVLLLRTDRC